jgi:hypothetical protein
MADRDERAVKAPEGLANELALKRLQAGDARNRPTLLVSRVRAAARGSDQWTLLTGMAPNK